MSKRNGHTADLSALSNLAPELAEMLVSVACDIAVVLDDRGVIQSVAMGGGEAVAGTAEQWVGRRWADTITDHTRAKAEQFLHDLPDSGVSRLRHLNHASAAGSEIPIAYTAVRLGEHGPALALGRDLSAVAAMQQRLMQTQQDIERDYWQRRQAETRYRLLFQVAAEPVLVLDAATYEILDANRAAAVLMGRAVEELNGNPITVGIEPQAHRALCELLDKARDSAQVAEGQTRLARGLGVVSVSATPFQTDLSAILLLLLRPLPAAASGPAIATAAACAETVFADLAKCTPDAIVVCDRAGRVTLANEAFYELAELPTGQAIVGLALSNWIGHQPGTVEAILATVAAEGSLRLLTAGLRRRNERLIDIELSAVRISGSDAVGFIIRIAHHQDSAGPIGKDSPDRDVH